MDHTQFHLIRPLPGILLYKWALASITYYPTISTSKYLLSLLRNTTGHRVHCQKRPACLLLVLPRYFLSVCPVLLIPRYRHCISMIKVRLVLSYPNFHHEKNTIVTPTPSCPLVLHQSPFSFTYDLFFSLSLFFVEQNRQEATNHLHLPLPSLPPSPVSTYTVLSPSLSLQATRFQNHPEPRNFLSAFGFIFHNFELSFTRRLSVLGGFGFSTYWYSALSPIHVHLVRLPMKIYFLVTKQANIFLFTPSTHSASTCLCLTIT